MSTWSVPTAAPLLERDAELRLFDARIAALRAADHEGGSCLLVHGEAGAGKTTLVQAARQRSGDSGAGGDGVEWLWGACEPLLAAPPLGPLIDLLDRLPPTLSHAVRSGHATPDVLSGMLAMLRDRAKPAVMVIDDVQWADSATLDLLRYVGRRIHLTRALLVLCWRDDALPADHPLRGLLGSLPPQRTVRVPLAALSPEAVAELAQRAGHSAQGLHAATHGNPFFVTEWLAGDGRRLPAAVRDAVLARAAQLSPAARDALALASVAPAGLEADVIDAIIDDAALALDECVAVGLLLRDGGWLRFRHELARQSVLAANDPARATALHGAVFDALSHAGAQTARLVHHAELAGLSRAVVQLAPLAADEAASAGAHRQAAAQYALALSHADQLDQRQQAALLVAHGSACMAGHQLDHALQSRQRALALHRHLNEPLAEGLDLRELARIEWFRGDIAQAKLHGAAAIEVLSRQAVPRELALAHATMGHLHLLDESAAAALEWSHRALAWFDADGDEMGIGYALSLVATAELIRDDQPRYWQWMERSLAIALQQGTAEPVSRLYASVASMALVHRCFERLHAACDAGIAYCDARDLDLYSARLRIRRAGGWIEQGLWPAARRELQGVQATPDLALREKQESTHLLALLDLRAGDPAAAQAWTAQLAQPLEPGRNTWYAPRVTAVAEAAWLSGDHPAVLRIARPALAAARRTGERWRIGQLACWLKRAGHDEALPAAFAADVALPFRLELEGDHRAAAAAWSALGCRYEQGLALLGGDADAKREALALFDALGALPAARLARQTLRALGIRDVPRGPYSAVRKDPQGLTPRERAVAVLLQQGLSNRAIAERLHRSERTVEHHVSSLLAKLGLSRAELSRAGLEK